MTQNPLQYKENGLPGKEKRWKREKREINEREVRRKGSGKQRKMEATKKKTGSRRKDKKDKYLIKMSLFKKLQCCEKITNEELFT